MAQTITTGVFSTEDALSNERHPGASGRSTLLRQDESQFLSILNKLPRPYAHGVTVTWVEGDVPAVTASFASSATSAVTSVTVTTGHGERFRVGDVIATVDGATGGGNRRYGPETMKVTAVSSDTLTVTRGFGACVPGDFQAGTPIINLSHPHAQGADVDTGALWASSTSASNYTQIFRQPVLFTGTAAQIERFGDLGGDEPKQVSEALRALNIHRRSIENSLFFGAKSLDTSGDQPIGYMGGLNEFLTDASGGNYTNEISGALSLSAFDTALDDTFVTGTQDKVIFCGPTFARALLNVYGANWQPARLGERAYGAPVTAYLNSQWGLIPVFVKGLWGRRSTTVGGYDFAGTMFLVDLGNVALRPMKGRYMKFLKGRNTGPGKDEVGYEYLSELSLEVSNPEAHKLIYGVIS